MSKLLTSHHDVVGAIGWTLTVNLVATQEAPDILHVNIAQRTGQQGPGPACEPFWRRLSSSFRIRLSVAFV